MNNLIFNKSFTWPELRPMSFRGACDEESLEFVHLTNKLTKRDSFTSSGRDRLRSE